MQITKSNYRHLLPESLWNAYLQLANSARGQVTPIIYIEKTLRYADADEL